MSRTPDIRKIRDYFRWLKLSLEEKADADLPLNKAQYCKANNVSKVTLNKWEKDRNEEVNPEIEYDSIAWLKSRTAEADIALMKACATGNAQALKLFNQLMGRLVEKTEEKVTHELNADQLIEIERRARQSLISNGREGEMSPKPSLLPTKVWQGERPIIG